MPLRSESQGILFADPLTIPDLYSDDRAKQAAKRRYKRVRQLAKDHPDERVKNGLKRTDGFKKRTGGLFVPRNGMENSAVVRIPLVKIQEDRAHAIQRTEDKYEGSDVSDVRISLWKHFAGQRAHEDTLRRYRSYSSTARSNAARIGMLVGSSEIDRELFTYDPEYRFDPAGHGAELLYLLK